MVFLIAHQVDLDLTDFVELNPDDTSYIIRITDCRRHVARCDFQEMSTDPDFPFIAIIIEHSTAEQSRAEQGRVGQNEVLGPACIASQ